MRATLRTRLSAAFVAVAVLAAAGLSLYFLTEIEAFALRKLEERLDTQAQTAAQVIAAACERSDGGARAYAALAGSDPAARALRRLGARTFTRLRLIDRRGVVLADSEAAESVGSDYSARSEIRTALKGGYGAASRQPDRGRVSLYVARPVTLGGRVVGVAYASSSTFSILTLLRDYRAKLGLLIGVYVVGALLLSWLAARQLARPLRRLEDAAGRLADDHSVRVEPEGPREVAAVADALNALAADIQSSTEQMRDEERRKSRFVSDVSHELRTPLTAIRGAAETLAAGDVPPEDERRFLGAIVSESDRLARLASDLISLQRIEGATGELPLARTDLREVAELAALALEPLAAERGVTVRVEGRAPAVLGDRDRLQQVVANLIDNATRMTPRGGTVRVRLDGADRQAVLEVLDQGPGIPEGDLASVFDRFYRAQPSRDRTTGGAGLGLAIVRAIVTAHAGTIDAMNVPGGGAVFTVRLPAIGGG